MYNIFINKYLGTISINVLGGYDLVDEIVVVVVAKIK